jgi:hypothetical protein
MSAEENKEGAKEVKDNKDGTINVNLLKNVTSA